MVIHHGLSTLTITTDLVSIFLTFHFSFFVLFFACFVIFFTSSPYVFFSWLNKLILFFIFNLFSFHNTFHFTNLLVFFKKNLKKKIVLILGHVVSILITHHHISQSFFKIRKKIQSIFMFTHLPNDLTNYLFIYFPSLS